MDLEPAYEHVLIKVTADGVPMVESVAFSEVELGLTSLWWDDEWLVAQDPAEGEVRAAIVRGSMFLHRSKYLFLERLTDPLSGDELEICRVLLAAGGNPRRWAEEVCEMISLV